MYSWFYRGSDLVVYPLVAMFLFIAVFIAVLLRTYARDRKPALDAAAALPFADEMIGDSHPLEGSTLGESHGQ